MNVPNHIAIILDGNGRWAKAKGMPRSYGHVKGCANLETVCDYMKELGVKYVTVYAFSTENWKRSKDEVDGLMKLFRSYLKKCIKLADKNKMRVRVIGEISAFDQDIQESIARLEQYSQKYDEIYFQIALNYGSRDEIIRGIRKLAQDAADGKVKPEEIDEHVFDNYLDTAGIPDPDLMIRTSGELRLSNFCYGRWLIQNFISRMWHGRILIKQSWSRLLRNIIRETEDTAELRRSKGCLRQDS